MEGVRPWGNPWGAEQFGASFFMITGFHGMHVLGGVIYLSVILAAISRIRDLERSYMITEIAGLYWHFVDLVWIMVFTFVYLL
jgi:cytochrome c oxidase subunit 3